MQDSAVIHFVTCRNEAKFESVLPSVAEAVGEGEMLAVFLTAPVVVVT